MPVREQNCCLNCNYSWFPRGHARSATCPNCRSRKTALPSDLRTAIATEERRSAANREQQSCCLCGTSTCSVGAERCWHCGAPASEAFRHIPPQPQEATAQSDPSWSSVILFVGGGIAALMLSALLLMCVFSVFGSYGLIASVLSRKSARKPS